MKQLDLVYALVAFLSHNLRQFTSRQIIDKFIDIRLPRSPINTNLFLFRVQAICVKYLF